MTTDIYHQLREQLDQYAVGFPTTASGVEMKILKKLFTEEEARMFLNLSLMLEAPESVAERTNQNPAYVRGLLDGMADKGLLFRHRREDSVRYAAEPFVIGFYEFQLKTMDRELAELVEQYFEEGFQEQTAEQILPLRSIPVNQALDVAWSVTPYEDVREIIKSKDRIAVANCICRVQQGHLGKGCNKPLEACFAFGSHAEYYVDREMGRWISQEEAIEILDRCDEAGLVPQPLNAQDPGGMCNCCGDCCGMLRALRKHPRPAQMVISNYYAEVDPDLCAACETCLERCQMDAITIGPDDVAVVNLDRCIGCGLCVTTCETEALTLKSKVAAERRDPPKTARDVMTRTAQQRGKSLIPLAFSKS
jgi:electron transport complex protein RnfB